MVRSRSYRISCCWFSAVAPSRAKPGLMLTIIARALMHSLQHGKHLMCCAIVLSCAGWCLAQPPVGTQGLPDRVPSALEKGVVKPDAFYLRDSGGNYIFVPNLRYEEFERLLRAQKPLLDPQLPTHQIMQWDIAGDVQGDLVRWKVTVKVRLSSAATGAVSIPIGLSDWHLSATPQFSGEGEHLLELMSTSAGYQWWIKGNANSEHTLQLQLISKVTQTIDRLSIKSSLPAAPIKVQVTVDGNNLRPEIEGQPGIVIATQAVEPNRTQISYETTGGNQNLQWRRGNEQTRAFAVECQSTTRVEVIDGGNPWKCKTTFAIQSTSSNVAGEFMITLPAGAQWQPSVPGATDANLYVLEEVATEAASATAASDALVRCRLNDSRRTGPLEISIDWNWTSPATENGMPIRFVAPQIQTVDRHEGYIELIYPTNYRLITLANSNAFPVPAETNSVNEGNTIRYRFDRHPASLNLSLRPEYSETRLRPTYVVEVYRNRVLLRGILDISLPQGSGSSVVMAPGTWSLSEVEQATTGAAVSIQPEGENRVRLQPPTSAAVASDATRNTNWRLEGVRELADDRSLPLNIDLPSLISEVPGVDSTRLDYGAGTLILVPADNVMLQPNDAETVGLIADSEMPTAAIEMIPQERRRRAVAYRFQAATAAPHWSGVRELLPQQVTAEADTQVDVTSQLVSVTQRWKVRVANEPLERLRMIVNRNAFERSAIIATIDGTTMSLLEVAADPMSSTVIAEDEVLVEFMQIGDLVGELQIAVDTKLPLELGEGKPVETKIALGTLLLPEKTGYLKSNLSLKHSPDIELLSTMASSREKGEWRKLDWATGNNEISLQTDSALNGIKLDLKRLDRLRKGSVRIARAWLQSAFNTAQRRDRMVFNVETLDNRVSFEIPAVNLDSLYDVLVDGKRGVYSVDKESSTLIVEIPADAAKPERCIELWSEAGRMVTGEAVEISIPKVMNSTGNPTFLWELVVPSSEHLLLQPSNMTPEWQWTWAGLGWHRSSAANQAELERWSGASSQTPLPARLNRYVMSGFGIPSGIRFTIVPKPWIWLPVGAAVIVLTLLWSTLRLFRHPVALATFFVAIATMAMYVPDAAMVLGQLAVVASVFALVMLTSQWAIGRRVKRRSVFTSYPPSGSQNVLSGSGVAPRIEKSNPAPLESIPNPPSGTATVASPGVVDS